MNKRENHWYVVGNVAEVLGTSMRPRTWAVGLWLFLIAGLAITYQTGFLERALQIPNTSALVPIFTVAVIVAAVATGLLLGFARRASIRTGYVRALASPTPDALIQVVEQSMKMSRALPDADALSAQAKALAYALYGREQEAIGALAGVNWKSKAPLVQGIGVSAEAAIELLCRRDVRRALELSSKARALASVSAAIPGAAQSERYHNTCVALGEVLLNVESATAVKWLEESAADARFPPLQLLASLGLAVAMERSGNGERAAQLQAFIRQTAPHGSPLHLKPEQFAVSTDQRTQEKEGPVSGMLSSPGSGGAVQERSAKRKIAKVVGTMVGVWTLLIVIFFAMYVFLAQPK